MLLTIGSITTATRAVTIIERHTKVRGQIIHTPRELNKGGCSYSIRYPASLEGELRKIVNDYKIPIKKWFGEVTEGRGYNDLS